MIVVKCFSLSIFQVPLTDSPLFALPSSSFKLKFHFICFFPLALCIRNECTSFSPPPRISLSDESHSFVGRKALPVVVESSFLLQAASRSGKFDKNGKREAK